MASPKTNRLTAKLNYKLVLGIVSALAIIAFLMLYKLGHLMPGITSGEDSIYRLPLGWHGLYHNPLNLPLNLLWTAVFKFFAPVGPTLLRLPAVLTGGLTIGAFFMLLKLWYGLRTAVIGSLLFAASAWTLHVSRLADYNVEYLAAMTFFLLSTAVLQRKINSKYVYWLINLVWSLMLFVPGIAFMIGYNIYRQRHDLSFGASLQKSFMSKVAYVFSGIIWVPLLGRYLIRSPKNILSWLGLPAKFASPVHIFKEFGAVFYHLFGKGPLTPDLWLNRVPILDIFSIVCTLLGIYFYARHYKATRTQLLGFCLIAGSILIALGGSVTLSILMPVIYVFIAAGVAYLLSQWLSVFPKNPIARGLGYTLIGLAVAASLAYNLRAYFIAWPHNSTSVSVFDVRHKD